MLRRIGIAGFIILLIICPVRGQFSYDVGKIESIRWSPLPEKVSGLDHHKMDLDGNWAFSTEPGKSFYKDGNLQEWNDIEVPGEWVMQGFDVVPGNYAGYFRTFVVPASWKDYRLKLKCEAVYSECTIWINGKEAGAHLGGFTPFEFDVSKLVKTGENSIALKVRSESLADTLSSASFYAVHPLGGITRSIYLVALPEVNLASFHVKTQFDDQFEDADLDIEIVVSNESSKPAKTELKFSLSDAEGNAVLFEGESHYNLTLARTEKQKFSTSLKVNNPLKWDCEHPNLYNLQCRVLVQDREVETLTRRFGFRQIDVRGNQVLINNRVIKLKGVCRHEVDPLRGRSLTGNQWYEDVRLFKEGNVNYIRTSHYPPHEKLLDACDELGMFVEVEAPFCWGSKGPVTDENYFETILQPTLEMVERDRSHPSVIIWSLGNESHDFEPLYQTSADLVKKMDPSRPRIFSQWNEQSDSGYLELGNFHYPGPSGPKDYASNKRPIIFDEYCHLNAYNRFELMTDPGLRDAWGRGFMMMWENMYKTPSVLGGALWAGIDDTFFLPTGEAVGYGTWGPVDGWRRRKPEYWHMKKAYSPVRIVLLAGDDDEPAKIQIENRYFFTNLNECTLQWKNNARKGSLEIDLEPGKTTEVSLPFKRSGLHELVIDVYKDSKVPVDQFSFSLSSHGLQRITKKDATFRWEETNKDIVAESDHIRVELTNSQLRISNADGNEILNGLPGLMLIPLNAEGAGGQMTKETPSFEIFSPEASNRKIEDISVETSASEIQISITDTYLEASGNTLLTISASGKVKVNYDYILRTELKLRQWGMSFRLSGELGTLKWKRNGLWSVYPEDHIGRDEGTAQLFNDYQECGLAGPKTRPDWGWSEDQTKYGSNDFRSTKRNIIQASLLDDKNRGIQVHSMGLQHIRSWYDKGSVNLLVTEYENPGAERFFRSHAKYWDQSLKSGDRISGSVHFEIVDQ